MPPRTDDSVRNDDGFSEALYKIEDLNSPDLISTLVVAGRFVTVERLESE